MRFRQRFPTLQVFANLVWITLSQAWIHKSHAIPGIRGAYGIAGIAWCFVLALTLSGYFFTWWDVNSDTLTEHRYWITKAIPWSEIYRVGPYRPLKKTLGDTLDIEYARTGPLSDRGHLVLLPLERQSFLQALRNHAPQAVFDL